MPEPIPAPNPPAPGPGSNPPAPAGSPPAPGQPGYVTTDQLDAAIGAAVQKALNPIFAQLRRQQDPPAPGNPPPAPGQPAGTPAQEQGIRERLQAAEQQLAKGEKRLLDASIREAAAALGVDAVRIPVLQAFIAQNHGKAITLNEKDEAVHVDAFQTATPVKDWLATLLKTPEGGMFLPPAKLPAVPRGGGPPLPAGETRSYMDLTLQERLDLEKPENTDKRRAYLAAAGIIG